MTEPRVIQWSPEPSPAEKQRRRIILAAISRCQGQELVTIAMQANVDLGAVGLVPTTAGEVRLVGAEAAAERSAAAWEGALGDSRRRSSRVIREVDLVLAEAARDERAMTREEAIAEAGRRVDARTPPPTYEIVRQEYEAGTPEEVAATWWERRSSIRHYWQWGGDPNCRLRREDPERADQQLLGLVNGLERTLGRPAISIETLREELAELWAEGRRHKSQVPEGARIIEWQPPR